MASKMAAKEGKLSKSLMIHQLHIVLAYNPAYNPSANNLATVLRCIVPYIHIYYMVWCR